VAAVLIRRENTGDIEAIAAVHTAAFEGDQPIEVGLVDALRASDAWLPALSLVALEADRVAGRPALGLGPLGVLPDTQRGGVGTALMHAVLGAADALGEPLVVLLGHQDYYPRFGFEPAAKLGIIAPDEAWGDHFQARTLSTYDPSLRGEFVYAGPFNDL
jgi:putative acetyltransferase